MHERHLQLRRDPAPLEGLGTRVLRAQQRTAAGWGIGGALDARLHVDVRADERHALAPQASRSEPPPCAGVHAMLLLGARTEPPLAALRLSPPRGCWWWHGLDHPGVTTHKSQRIALFGLAR